MIMAVEYSVAVSRAIERCVLLTLSVVMLAACQYDPWAHGYLTTAPSEAAIVGKYTPDKASRSRRISLPMTGVVVPVDPSAEIVLADSH